LLRTLKHTYAVACSVNRAVSMQEKSLDWNLILATEYCDVVRDCIN